MLTSGDPRKPQAVRWLCCPECHEVLLDGPEKVYCGRCGKSWAVRDQVADFTASSRRAGEGRFETYTEALPELVRRAQVDGWLEALKSTIRPLPGIGPGMFSYVTDESKGDLLFLMNIELGHRVLDLGCGLGVLSVAIGRRAGACYVVDISLEQVAFTAIRCRQMGLSHVSAACAGDDMRLPVADDYFDAIVMNGVLEWVGCADRYRGSPEEAQLAMLSEANRVLRPGGQLYVASKNRYALLHFLGAVPDHVSKLPWIGLLPQHLQSLLTLGRARDCGARIYGLHGYRRLFEAAGFTQRAAYAVMPDFRHPRRFIPLDSGGPKRSTRTGSIDFYNRRLEGILARLLPGTLFRHTVYCYGFLLGKT